jgi:hypothetical protein
MWLQPAHGTCGKAAACHVSALNFLRDILRVSRDCLGGLSHALFGGFLD